MEQFTPDYYERVVLFGRHVRVEPLGPAHVADLYDAAQDDDIWRWLGARRPPDQAAMVAIVAAALDEQARGERVPFALVERASGRAVGSTSFLDIAPEHRRLEIGWTWLGRPWWRTAVNTEAKLLLLRHCFERLGALRVALKTDHVNLRSQAAIERLGAVREGVLRHHHVRPDGSLRDTVYYSVLAAEWPEVERRLGDALDRVA